MTFKILYVKKAFLNYFLGMNAYAAKALKISFPYSDNIIAIVEKLPTNKEQWLIKHEKIEAGLMKSGMSYREAHAKTLLLMGDFKTKLAALRDADRMIMRLNK